MVEDRVMIFHPNENLRFISNQSNIGFQWTGEFLGEIDHLVNQIPAMKGTKLFQLYPANQYVILTKYDTKTHIIELIKRIYGLYIIPYNLCIYKKKQYIMYLYIPFNEIQYSLHKKKKDEVSDDERIIFFFHWMLGVKGRAIQIYINGGGSNSIIISSGKYSSVNYQNTQLSQGAINKFFGTYHNFQDMAAKFNVVEKLDQIRALMNDSNFWWFEEFQNRIISNVVPSNISTYIPQQIGNYTPIKFNTKEDNGEFVMCSVDNPLFRN